MRIWAAGATLHRSQRRILPGLAAALIVASNAGDSACTVTGGPMVNACLVDTRGIRAEHGIVVDVVTARCDPRPLQHTLVAFLSYRSQLLDEWSPVGAQRRSFTIPDARGVKLRVSTPCTPGYYRTEWHAWGRGSPLDVAPNGIPFDVWDRDMFATHIDSDECGL